MTHQVHIGAATYGSLQHQAQLAIIRTGLELMDAFEQVLKPYGVTSTQFNVLRILRGADSSGLCRNEIRDRLVNRMPDVTRLLDRMEDAGLIDRERSSEDRRMVYTRITPAGMQLLKDVDEDVTAEQMRPFRDMDEKDLERLIGLIGAVRPR